jgi:hypothetical protein
MPLPEAYNSVCCVTSTWLVAPPPRDGGGERERDREREDEEGSNAESADRLDI